MKIINRPGILRLVAKSTMPRAMEFFDWIADEVLPQLLEYGTYSMKSPKSELAKLTKNFYEDNDISPVLKYPNVCDSYMSSFDIYGSLKLYSK